MTQLTGLMDHEERLNIEPHERLPAVQCIVDKNRECRTGKNVTVSRV